MRSLFLFIITISINISLCAQYVLDNSNFYRINDTQFWIYSIFDSGDGACYPQQERAEVLSNDTLYLKIVFETRLIVPAQPCNRTDTIEQTMLGQDIHYVNVSTGIVTFDQNDPMVADTVWSIFDSTFAAVAEFGEMELNSLRLSVSNGQLTANAPYKIDQMSLVDVRGRQIATCGENQINVTFLSSGVYLVYIFSGKHVQTVRWYKE